MLRNIALGIVAAAFLAVSVVAFWPVVAEAPWENSNAPADETAIDEIRCQGALDFRTAALASPPTRASSPILGGALVVITDQEALQLLLAQADSEIARYC